MNYAEALNECEDSHANRQEALEYVNKIRERAGIRQYTLEAVDPVFADEIQVDDTQEAVRKACLLYTSCRSL